MKRPNITPLEGAEQAALFAWARACTGRWPELELLHSIPNWSGNLPVTVRAKLKREGKQAGVPDVVLPCARGGWHGLYIEMKRREGGTTSEEQKWWIRRLTLEGYRVEVAKGAQEAVAHLMAYLAMARSPVKAVA